MKEREIAAHELTITVRVPEWVPGHVERGHDMPDFQHNRQQLLAEGHGYCYGCAIAGIHNMTALQCHHFAVEWSEWESTDPHAALYLMRLKDPYGYAATLGNQPVASPNDIRNLLMLCEGCHISRPQDPATIVDQPTTFISGGIHYTPEPLWYADRLRVHGQVALHRTGGL